MSRTFRTMYMATLDCAGVPRHGLDIPLPENGRLVFFVHEDFGETVSRDRARVIYIPASTVTRPRPRPEETIHRDFSYDGEAQLVVERVVPTIPDLVSMMVTTLGIPEELDYDLADCVDDLIEEFDSWRSQVGGHPNWVQCPISLDGEGNECKWGDGENPAYMERDWLLLATTPDSCGGTFYWLIRSGDLAERRFDRAVLQFQI
ncbi:DUF1963 domain-containing protein [Streptomyces scopuliridis]|uniref:DUF1963 domain-containing protein n=1 Tax=Streptomyces scopuliridis TaxID=452529 RepID=UPI0034268E02